MTYEGKFDVLLDKVDGVLKLLALQTVSGKKTGEAVAILGRAGLGRRAIAEVLNTTQDSVRGFISMSKKPKVSKSAKNKKEAEVAT
jgi:ABC-type phosphate/phosphonate transport system ATPase subunit